MFLSFDESIIAQQLTYFEFKLFSSIRSFEFLNQSWIKPQHQWKSHHVVSLVDRTNRMAFWVSSMILFPERLSERVQMIEKFIKIAEVKEFQNFFFSSKFLLLIFISILVFKTFK